MVQASRQSREPENQQGHRPCAVDALFPEANEERCLERSDQHEGAIVYDLSHKQHQA